MTSAERLFISSELVKEAGRGDQALKFLGRSLGAPKAFGRLQLNPVMPKPGITNLSQLPRGSSITTESVLNPGMQSTGISSYKLPVSGMEPEHLGAILQRQPVGMNPNFMGPSSYPGLYSSQRNTIADFIRRRRSTGDRTLINSALERMLPVT